MNKISKLNLLTCIFLLMLILNPHLHSQIIDTNIEEKIDTVMGKQELEFQKSVEEQALGDKVALRQFIIDSLRLIYDEGFQETLDSIQTLYENKVADVLQEKEAVEQSVTNALQKVDSLKSFYTEQIFMLLDSLKSIKNLMISIGPELKGEYDPVLEKKYFIYEKMLKQENPKKARRRMRFIGGPTENIFPFQISELESYLELFFPHAHSDSLQDFLTQLYIKGNDWPEAEVSILKFLYLYPESPLYKEIKNVRSLIFQTEKYYKEYSDHLMTLVNAEPTGEDISRRYFNLLDILRELPDPETKMLFIDEAQQFVKLYPNNPKAPVVNIWIGYVLLEKELPHSAYLTFQKLMRFYPQSDNVPVALLNCGVIQQDKFNEYNDAVETFRDFLSRFPEDTLALDVQYRVAKISDDNLKDWETAVVEYQKFADNFPQSDNAIPCLMRKGEILATKLKRVSESVETYNSIEENYHGEPKAREAITIAGDLYNKNKEYELAVSQYMSIFEKYPSSVEALNALEKASDIYDKKLKDKTKTIEILNLIVTNFPGTKNEEKAVKRLKKLQK